MALRNSFSFFSGTPARPSERLHIRFGGWGFKDPEPPCKDVGQSSCGATQFAVPREKSRHVRQRISVREFGFLTTTLGVVVVEFGTVLSAGCSPPGNHCTGCPSL